jgi:2-haloacid dehalogenase
MYKWLEWGAGRRPHTYRSYQHFDRTFPDHAENIKAYYSRWPEMLGGVIEGTVEIFKGWKKRIDIKSMHWRIGQPKLFPSHSTDTNSNLVRWDSSVGTEKIRKPAVAFYQLC